MRKAHGFDFHLIRRLRRHIPLRGEGFFRGARTLLRIRLLRQPGIEGTEETGFASHYGIAPHPVGNGLAHSVCQTLVGTKIYIVGAGIARPFLTVSAALSGRAAAIYAF